MPVFADLTGKRFGRLVVVKRGETINSHTYWACLCDCGNAHTTRQDALVSGLCKSCGCIYKTTTPLNATKHGMYKTRLYNTWDSMRGRCNTKTDKAFKHYGGRGIKVCEEWDDFSRFMEWALNNGYEDHLSIERIDVNGNYCPDNCTFIPFSQQARNKTNTARILLEDGSWTHIDNITSTIGLTYATAYHWYKYIGLRTIQEFIDRKIKLHGAKRSEEQ